jgi:hypothetical protein
MILVSPDPSVPLPPADGVPSSCFVVRNSRREWWTGGGWSREAVEARRYPDQPDPHRQAREAAAEVEELTGTACDVYLIPADQARAFFALRQPPAGGEVAS